VEPRINVDGDGSVGSPGDGGPRRNARTGVADCRGVREMTLAVRRPSLVLILHAGSIPFILSSDYPRSPALPTRVESRSYFRVPVKFCLTRDSAEVYGNTSYCSHSCSTFQINYSYFRPFPRL